MTRLLLQKFSKVYFALNAVAASLSSSLPPAEDTLVRTGEAGGRLHASVGLDAIESVFVTATSPSQHRL